MQHLPNPIHIALLSGVFAVVAFILTFAQRIGDWRSRGIARILGAIGALLIVLWLYLACLWIFAIDLRTLFGGQSMVFWIILGTLSAMGVGVIAVNKRQMSSPRQAAVVADSLLANAVADVAPLPVAPGATSELSTGADTDEATLESLQAVLPSSAIADLRIQQFWTTFTWRFDAVLTAFYRWGLLPEHRFLNDDLEKIHARLRDLAYVLYDRVHRYTEKLSPTDDEIRGFTPLGPITDMAEHEANRNEVWETKTKVCDAYEALITTARRKFAGSELPNTGATPSLPDMSLTIDDIRFYDSTVLLDTAGRHVQRVFITVLFSLVNRGREATADIGSLRITLGNYQIDSQLVSLSGTYIPEWIKRDWDRVADIEEITHNMVVASGHAISRYSRFCAEVDKDLVPAVRQHGTFRLSVVDSFGTRVEAICTQR